MDLVVKSFKAATVKELSDCLAFPHPKGSGQVVAGLYITDSAVCAVTGRLPDDKVLPSGYQAPNHWPLLVDDLRACEHTADMKSVDDVIAKMASAIYVAHPEVRAIGIGCYGPFDSLDVRLRPRDHVASFDEAKRRYGQVLANTMHTVGRKTNLDVFGIVAKTWSGVKHRPEIEMQTDVAVTAFGEAIFQQANRYLSDKLTPSDYAANGFHRSTTEGETIACIKASIGANAAIVAERAFWPKFRSSEMGNIHVTPHLLDPLPRKGVPPLFEALVSEKAIIDRLEAISAPFGIDQLRAGVNQLNLPVWLIIANYVAQLAVDITFMAIPNYIILAGRTLRTPGLIDLVQNEFVGLMGDRAQVGAFRDARASGWSNYLRAPAKHYTGLFGSIFLAASIV